jgi:Ser/Thr protein kinase RdoA (MazF antagonist)
MKQGPSFEANKKPEMFSPQELAVVADLYNLGNLTFVRSPDSGIITDNAIVENEEGEQFFIKRYNESDMQEHASAYTAAETVAAQGEASVLMPLVPQTGSYTVELAGKTLSVFPAIEHSPAEFETIEEKLHLLRQMGAQLGKIHGTNLNNVSDRVKPIFRWGEVAAKRRGKTMRDILERIPREDAASEFDRVALEIIELKQSLLERFSYPTDEMSTAICHGDFHKNNILFDEHMDVITVCDWDNAGLSNPYVDFLNTYLSEVVGNQIDSLEIDCTEIAKAFATAYCENTGKPFVADEL